MKQVIPLKYKITYLYNSAITLVHFFCITLKTFRFEVKVKEAYFILFHLFVFVVFVFRFLKTDSFEVKVKHVPTMPNLIFKNIIKLFSFIEYNF